MQATLIFYESPKRLGAFLADAVTALGGGRAAAICRELTKRFEEVQRGTLTELAETAAARDFKGEIVVLIDRATTSAATEDQIAAALDSALISMSVKDAATFVSQTLNVSRKIAYKIALSRSQD